MSPGTSVALPVSALCPAKSRREVCSRLGSSVRVIVPSGRTDWLVTVECPCPW